MIILASAIIISLNNSNIINKANEAVDSSNLNQVQHAAALIWADAYLDPDIDNENITASYIKSELEKQGINTDGYAVIVEDNGVTVKEEYTGPTLGSLITSAEMYGTKVNYEANGVTDWKVFYKQKVNGEEYVYLIASEKLAKNKVPTALQTSYGATIDEATVDLGEDGKRTVGQIYWKSAPSGIAVAETAKDKWLAKWPDYTSGINAKCVSYFLDENIWKDFANTKDYVDDKGKPYVVGAIGTPTAEMFVASWNAKREATGDTTKYDKKLKLGPKGTTGYYVNYIEEYSQSISTSDNLYIWSTASYSSVWLASPSGSVADRLLYAGYNGYVGLVSYIHYNDLYYGVRPVVCLKSNIPVSLVDGNLVIK